MSENKARKEKGCVLVSAHILQVTVSRIIVLTLILHSTNYGVI